MNLSDLFFWKHKSNQQIIKQECFDKLPEHYKINYEQTKKPATHSIEFVDRVDEDDDGILFNAITTSLIADALIDSSDTSHDMGGSYDSSDSSFDFDGFGGGDTGGGGAGGDW